MEKENEEKLNKIEAKIDAVFVSTEKTRKYFQIIFWITIAMVVLPVVGFLFALPAFMNTYLGSFDGLL